MKGNIFLVFLLSASANCQSNKDLYNGQANNEYYGGNQDTPRQTRLPSPGDSDYRTYVYNNRRYGVDPTRYNPYNPNINQPGGFPYNPLYTNPLDDQYKYVNVSKCKYVFILLLPSYEHGHWTLLWYKLIPSDETMKTMVIRFHDLGFELSNTVKWGNFA